MDHEEFPKILHRAIAGNNVDIENLLAMYSPLINKVSIIRDKLNEDLRQYIIMHIVKNLSKFKI